VFHPNHSCTQTIAPPQALRQLQLEGVLVLDVPAGSPAYKAGMTGISKDGFGRVVIGDVIVGIKGKPVRSERDLFDVLDSCRVGEKVQVEVLRKGEEKRTLNVALGERAPEPSD
jgi:S1-C subfamily serine protease